MNACDIKCVGINVCGGTCLISKNHGGINVPWLKIQKHEGMWQVAIESSPPFLGST